LGEDQEPQAPGDEPVDGVVRLARCRRRGHSARAAGCAQGSDGATNTNTQQLLTSINTAVRFPGIMVSVKRISCIDDTISRDVPHSFFRRDDSSLGHRMDYFRREASTGSSLRSIGNCFTWANPANSARSFSAWAAVWPVLCSLCGKALRRGLNIGMEKR